MKTYEIGITISIRRIADDRWECRIKRPSVRGCANTYHPAHVDAMIHAADELRRTVNRLDPRATIRRSDATVGIPLA